MSVVSVPAVRGGGHPSVARAVAAGAPAGIAAGLVYGAAMAQLGLLPTVATLVGLGSSRAGFAVHLARLTRLARLTGLLTGRLSGRLRGLGEDDGGQKRGVHQHPGGCAVLGRWNDCAARSRAVAQCHAGGHHILWRIVSPRC